MADYDYDTYREVVEQSLRTMIQLLDKALTTECEEKDE